MGTGAGLRDAVGTAKLRARLVRNRGGTYATSLLVVGEPARARAVLDAVENGTGWPWVSLTCEAGEDWSRLCRHVITAHEEVFGPTQRLPGAGRREHAELLLGRTAGRGTMPAFNLVIWEPQRLTPRTARGLSSWVKQPAHGLVVLVGPAADGVLVKDAELLPHYLTLLRV